MPKLGSPYQVLDNLQRLKEEGEKKQINEKIAASQLSVTSVKAGPVAARGSHPPPREFKPTPFRAADVQSALAHTVGHPPTHRQVLQASQMNFHPRQSTLHYSNYPFNAALGGWMPTSSSELATAADFAAPTLRLRRTSNSSQLSAGTSSVDSDFGMMSALHGTLPPGLVSHNDGMNAEEDLLKFLDFHVDSGEFENFDV